jgi:hypothetical protein
LHTLKNSRRLFAAPFYFFLLADVLPMSSFLKKNKNAAHFIFLRLLPTAKRPGRLFFPALTQGPTHGKNKLRPGLWLSVDRKGAGQAFSEVVTIFQSTSGR